MKPTILIKTSTVFISLALAQYAAASGYHFGTQSVTAQSTANSAAAEAADATTVFTNPAGLSQLPENQVSATVNLVAPHIRYSDAEAQYIRGGAVSGSKSGKITKDLVIAPHMYGAYRLNDRITLGLGVYVPFASQTEYAGDSVLRYNMNQLGLATIAIQPTVAFKINEQHSIGIGLSAQHSSAKLRKYADWSAAYSDAQLQGLAALQGNPALADRNNWRGYAQVKGDDWGFGYQLGYLFNINERARIGLSYRSKVEHRLKGHAQWVAEGAVAKAQGAVIQSPTSVRINTPSGVQQGRGYVAGEGASVRIVTPESLSVHGMFQATDKLNLFGDVTWTRHSRFNQASLIFENEKIVNAQGGKSNATTITPNWRDTFKVALGGSYQINEPLQLRAGIAFDQSPVRSAALRMNTLPDGHRIWFSAGAKYKWNKKHELDVAYSHVHINDTTFESGAASGRDVDSRGPSRAKFNNYANILGMQYTYKF